VLATEVFFVGDITTIYLSIENVKIREFGIRNSNLNHEIIKVSSFLLFDGLLNSQFSRVLTLC
jgi:hypothetical protein